MENKHTTLEELLPLTEEEKAAIKASLDEYRKTRNFISHSVKALIDASVEERPISTIQWQTGTPTESGLYIVSIIGGYVACDTWRLGLGWRTHRDDAVKAWCKTSYILPYKKKK